MDEHNNNNDEHERQREHHNPITLSLEGQKVLSIIESISRSELPPSVDRQINEALNDFADIFLNRVRSSIIDVLIDNKSNEPERGLIKIITDKDWHKEEEKIEKAIRFFPDVLLEKRNGLYPIQSIALLDANMHYNIKKVSLIPLVAELGSELGLFDKEMRGGLLCKTEGYRTPLESITSYTRNEFTRSNNEHLDACFLTIWKRLRENNLLWKEDIQKYNIVGEIISSGGKNPNLAESRNLNYFIHWDPTPLSIPCLKEYGTCLPIHYSTLNQTIREFSIMLQMGMCYFPDKFGYVFCRGTQTDENDATRVDDGTAFQFACKKYGHEAVTKVVLDCISDYYQQCGTTTSSPSSSSTTATRLCAESLLLMSTVTDETIHVDGLYMLIRRDPNAALIQLQQHLRLLPQPTPPTRININNNTSKRSREEINTITAAHQINDNNNNKERRCG